MDLFAAVSNVRHTLTGGVADLRRMPRDRVAVRSADTPRESRSVLYRYRPLEGVVPLDEPPLLLVPPLGAPDFAYDLRRGCSLVEHLLGTGRTVYLVDYGGLSFADRRRGLEHLGDGGGPWGLPGTAQEARRGAPRPLRLADRRGVF